MFKFLKDKLQSAINKISKKAEKEAEVIKEESIKEEVKKEKTIQEELTEEVIKEQKEEKPSEELIKEEKKGFVKKLKERIGSKKISGKEFEEMFEELEITLLENNIAFEVIEKIKQDLKETLTSRPIPRKKIKETIIDSLKTSIEDLFKEEPLDLIEEIKRSEKPFIIVFVGINGSGKTTTIAKIAKLLQKNKISSVLAAADTFRAASIEQLEEHAKKLNLRVIKHNYGSDPAAVAFDAIKYAKAHKIDTVLIDTAGRMHSNTNLVDEMKKIIRVAKPNFKIFVGEAITGNDCIEQAKQFNKAIDIDGIILAKADIDEKGGASISTSFVTGKPILFLGTGQKYTDLEEFNKEKLISTLGL